MQVGTRAIIPVHYGGHVCDMDRIMDLARRHNLIVIEDAAHAPGAVYKGRKVGSLGDLATFSFQESKIMTAGEGGIITTNNPELAEKCVQYRSCGRHEGESWYIHYVLPLNYRLAEVLSAMLLAQLERLDDQLKTKQAHAAYLAQRFNEVDGINPVPGDGHTDVNGYYWYLLQYNQSKFAGVSRDRFVEALNAEGIPSHIGYPWPLNKNPLFETIQEGAAGCPYTCPYYQGHVEIRSQHFPVSERVCRETVVIHHQVLLAPREDLDDIVTAILKIQDQTQTLI